jgi:hypothetical protein
MGQCTETVLPEISAHMLIGYMRVSTDGDRQILDHGRRMKFTAAKRTRTTRHHSEGRYC